MRRLCVLILAAGLLVWLAAPALSARPFVPRAVDFEQALDAAAPGAARAAGGAWRSGVIRAPKRFDLVGLKWRAPHRVTVRIRVRDADSGRWSRWTLTGENHGEQPGTEPVWAGGADAYQLRTDRRARGLRAHFVNATGTATARDRAMTRLRRVAHAGFVALAGSARAQTPPGAPAIVTREEWGADQCPPREAPSYGRVDMGFVHHTVSANEYGPEDSAAIVLSICRFHRNSNGWNDVGYNFLVDRYGRIFEGRAGGVDQAVIGAQAQGYNGVSSGVSNIGTFSNVPQTAEGIAATARVLAWKLSLHGAPAQGQVLARSGGGNVNRYPAGTDVTFERIAAHRDADATACPGDVLFAQLPEIRRQAAALAPGFAQAARGGLDLQIAQRRVTYPQPVQLTGRLTAADGRAMGGVRVSVQVRTGRRFTTVALAQTGEDGAWSAQVRTAYSRTLRAVAQPADGPRVDSLQRTVLVAPAVSARASSRRVRMGRPLTVRGTVRPAKARLVAEVARRGSDARYHVVARVPVAARKGRFTKVLRPQRPALTRVRILSRADARNQPGLSVATFVRVAGR